MVLRVSVAQLRTMRSPLKLWLDVCGLCCRVSDLAFVACNQPLELHVGNFELASVFAHPRIVVTDFRPISFELAVDVGSMGQVFAVSHGDPRAFLRAAWNTRCSCYPDFCWRRRRAGLSNNIFLIFSIDPGAAEVIWPAFSFCWCDLSVISRCCCYWLSVIMLDKT